MAVASLGIYSQLKCRSKRTIQFLLTITLSIVFLIYLAFVMTLWAYIDEFAYWIDGR